MAVSISDKLPIMFSDVQRHILHLVKLLLVAPVASFYLPVKPWSSWEQFSRNAQSKAQEFTFDKAAAGILAAFRYLEVHREKGVIS
jgi:hypothetical protein